MMTRALGSLALLVLSTVGCVDDLVRPDEELPLTEEEAELLGLDLFYDAMVRALETSEASSNLRIAPAFVRVPIFERDSTTRLCEFGGSVAIKVTVTGDADTVAHVGTLDLTAVITHLDCQNSEGATRFLINGDPHITLAMELVGNGSGTTAITGRLFGAVTASAGYRGNTCEIDLPFNGSLRGDGAATLVFTGTVCRQAATRTVEIPSSVRRSRPRSTTSIAD
jgi:hypothetical protein